MGNELFRLAVGFRPWLSKLRRPLRILCCRRPYRVEYTGSLLTSEVKRRRARLVLGWGTAREDLRVLSAFYLGPLVPTVSGGRAAQIAPAFQHLYAIHTTGRKTDSPL